MDVHAFLRERGELVDGFLEKVLPTSPGAPEALCGAMRHLVFPGGKRLRPALCFAAAEAVGAAPERALPMAAAVELLHTYSLVHDDLPCMDDDSERRGRPTVHVVYGEAVAVLAGDALQALAFEVLAQRGARAGPTERVLGAMRDLAVAAGAGALVGGQVDDLAFPAEGSDPAAVESVHLRKSAALIAASVVGGARLGGADAATVARMRSFGENVGLAFQIADDVLDRDEDGACSLVRLLGVDGARRRAETLLADALGELDELGERAEPLRELARFAVRREI
ncbi:geranylgeranyl diphosphate synthase, type II [Myxococcaceae bacterium]|jgi:geranylgeranyl pyrophosphate synthase|nr:geranylgeranyl diphosphate synthase, type II [Myxococcaceae bacterium]